MLPAGSGLQRRGRRAASSFSSGRMGRVGVRNSWRTGFDPVADGGATGPKPVSTAAATPAAVGLGGVGQEAAEAAVVVEQRRAAVAGAGADDEADD